MSYAMNLRNIAAECEKRKIVIRFSTNRNGKRIAHYFGLACRWLPISIETAELKLASGEAVPYEAYRSKSD